MRAIKDCWLVGDEFFGEIHHTLQELKSECSTTPYLYEQYNVMPFYLSALSPQPRVIRILNAFIDALNSTPKLPKYVLIIPDQDLMPGSKHLDYGVVHIMEQQLRWLFQQINKAIGRRREDLQSKHAGAISHSTYEPRIICIAMIDRPFTSNWL